MLSPHPGDRGVFDLAFVLIVQRPVALRTGLSVSDPPTAVATVVVGDLFAGQGLSRARLGGVVGHGQATRMARNFAGFLGSAIFQMRTPPSTLRQEYQPEPSKLCAR